MFKIDSTGHANNQFTEGNVGLGVPATVVSADWLNAVQGELIGLLTAAGIAPDKANNGQVLAALQVLYAAKGGSNLQRFKVAVAQAHDEAIRKSQLDEHTGAGHAVFVPSMAATVIKNGAIASELIAVTGAPANATVVINFLLDYGGAGGDTLACLHSPGAVISSGAQCNMTAGYTDSASRTWKSSGQIIVKANALSQVQVTLLTANAPILQLSVAGWWA